MADVLCDWVASLGGPVPPAAALTADTIDEWLGHAGGRPEWLLWGKAQPKGSCPAHSLLCHMLDVAAVAARLLTAIQPPAVRDRLLALSTDRLDSLRTLLFVIALHDLGKATPAFQAKVDWARREFPKRGFDLQADQGARFHGDIGLFFLKPELEEHYGASTSTALRLARAVTAHHGQFPTDASVCKPPGSRERGRKAQWDSARAAVVKVMADHFRVTSLSGVAQIDHAYVVLLAGVTSVADWIGSMEDFFLYEPPQRSLPTYWRIALARADTALENAGFRPAPPSTARSFRQLFPQLDPWPLHSAADSIAPTLDTPSLIVVEAPMGEGKTEAALTLADAAAAQIGEGGFYIGLPTQATANQMFGRIERFLARTRGGALSTLLLAHGEASLWEGFRKLRVGAVYDSDAEGVGAVRAEAWFLSKKRKLLGEFAVGTIDQALLGVMRVPHAFVRLYGLASKVVIFDEIHAYDTYTSNLLDRLVEWLAATGTTVVLLSATLPSSRRADLLRAYRKGAGMPEGEQPTGPYPRITLASRTSNKVDSFAPRGKPISVGVERSRDDVDELTRRVIEVARRGGCVGWICNTVARAQEATTRVCEMAAGLGRLLLHSQLLPADRVEREERLAKWLGPEGGDTERPEGCVVIGTQVLEQSLDVDFDFMVTDVAPMDLLLQRAGRLWRHQRGNRFPGVKEPRLTIVCPDGPWTTASLDQVAVVYAEMLVRRTLEKLENTETFTLPTDIEPLVEEVYCDRPVAAGEQLHAAWIAHHGAKAVQRNLSEQKLMPHPYVVDDPFGNLRVFLTDDDDPVLHQQLRADTRLGPPSVELLCVDRRGGQLLVGDGDETPLDLCKEPDWLLVERLVRRSIGVSNRRAFHAIINDPQTAIPESWKKSPLLRYRRLLAFEEGRARVAGVSFVLDAELGLCIRQADKAS